MFFFCRGTWGMPTSFSTSFRLIHWQVEPFHSTRWHNVEVMKKNFFLCALNIRHCWHMACMYGQFTCIQIKFMWMTVKRMWNQSNCVEMSMTKSFFFLLERERTKRDSSSSLKNSRRSTIDWFLILLSFISAFLLTIYNHSIQTNQYKKKIVILFDAPWHYDLPRVWS